MALKIVKDKIVGTIDNIQEKLNGELPTNRLELIYLVNSWGRYYSYSTNINNEGILINKTEDFISLKHYDLSKLDVSRIIDMEDVFKNSMFNGDISNWDVSNVTNMKSMFYHANDFNSDISNWDISKVTSLEELFFMNKKFNQPIGNWDTSNVTNMVGVFCDTQSFNQALNWNTSKVTSMEAMFFSTYKFNQPLNFDTTNLKNTLDMFYSAKEFNSELNFSDTSKLIKISFMFGETQKFNQPLNFNNTSNLIYMDNVFNGAKAFNQLFNLKIPENASIQNLFYKAEAFKNKFNNGEEITKQDIALKKWLIENLDRMIDIDLKSKYGKEVDDFFNNIYSNKNKLKEIE